ncbi:MAG: hypothetical protein ACTHJ2_04255 [Candidatus Nitrosocosmicus sp.]
MQKLTTETANINNGILAFWDTGEFIGMVVKNENGRSSYAIRTAFVHWESFGDIANMITVYSKRGISFYQSTIEALNDAH